MNVSDRSLRKVRFLSLANLLAFFLAFGIIPLAWMVLQAIRTAVNSDALTDPSLWPLLGRTVALSFSVALGATLLGTIGGYLLGATDWPGKMLCRAILVLPLAIPPYLHAIGWTTLFRPRGLFSSWASLLFGISPSLISEGLYSFGGAVAVLILAYFPIALLFTERSLALSSPVLGEAARVEGANRWQAFAVHRWPFLKPAVASSAMIVFLLASSDLGVPTILTVPVFNFEVFTQLGAFNDVTTATLLTIPLIVLGFLALTVERRLTVGSLYETDVSDIEPPRAATSGETRFNWLFFLVLVVIVLGLPIGAIVSQAFDYEALSQMSQLAKEPTLNTFQYAGSAAILITVIAFGLAWLLRNASPALLRGSDFILIVGFAVPSTILALSLLAVYDRPELTRWISPAVLVVAALVVRYAIIGYRIAALTIAQFPGAMLEAAAIDGASPIRIAWHILLPLTHVAVLATLTIAFVFSVGEIGSTILLHPPGGETLPIALYSIEANSPRSYVAAMTLIQLLVSLSPLLLVALALKATRQGRNDRFRRDRDFLLVSNENPRQQGL